MFSADNRLKAYEAAFNMSDGLIFFVKDEDRRYQLANRGLADMCDVREADQLIGTESANYFSKDYARWCQTLDDQVLEGYIFADRLDCLKDARGKEVWTLYSRRAETLDTGQKYILSLSKILPLNNSMRKAYRRLKTVSDMMAENPQTIFSLAKLSELAQCSTSQLDRNFSDVLQISPNVYQMRGRAQFAASLIRTGQPLSDVAAECGFSDQTAFSRFFKRVTRQSPSEFRKRQSAASRHAFG